MGDEEKTILLNDNTLKLQPESEFVYSVSSIISGSNKVELAGADENVSLLVLEQMVSERNERFGFSRLGGHFRISFKSCTVNELIFALITSKCENIDVMICFSGDCRMKIRESSSMWETAELLDECEQTTMRVRVNSELDAPKSTKDFWVDLEIGGNRKELPELASCFQTLTWMTRETNYRYVPFISVKDVDNELQITDVPLMMSVVHLPFFDQLIFEFPYKPKSGQGEITLKAFDEIRKRSATLEPCAFENHSMTDYSRLSYILDHFNEAKIFKLWIPIHKDCTKEFLTKALDVIAQSVYLRTLRVYIPSWLQYDLCLFFVSRLRKMYAKIMPVFLILDYPEQSPPPQSELLKLKDEIKRIFWRNTREPFRSFLVIASVHTLGSARIGPACILQMLPVELLRLLHSCLISFNDQ